MLLAVKYHQLRPAPNKSSSADFAIGGWNGAVILRGMPRLFYRLPQNIIAAFRGRSLIWHAAAIVITIVIVMTGGDWAYFRATRPASIQHFARPAISLGFFLPVWGPLALLLVAVLARHRRLITTAWALGQAALLGYLITCCYKAFTGRLPPPYASHSHLSAAYNSSMVDSSHGFQFGFLRGGVFWGWPSSHTTVAFSMSVCLALLYPKNRLVLCLALLYAFYIGFGISVSIHWLSEFVAGGLIGSAIGTAVGRGFRDGEA